MEQKERGSRASTVASYAAVLGALWLLLSVCGRCCPEAEAWLRETLAGVETGPAREAFGTLAQELQEGESVPNALEASIAVFREQTH